MLITDSWDIPASSSRSNEQKWTSQRLCLYSPQFSRPSVGLYYPLQPTSLHLPTRKLYRFHLFLPEFVSLENAFHFINGFQTFFSVKLSITEILTENPKSICQEQRCSHVKQGAAGGTEKRHSQLGFPHLQGLLPTTTLLPMLRNTFF